MDIFSDSDGIPDSEWNNVKSKRKRSLSSSNSKLPLSGNKLSAKKNCSSLRIVVLKFRAVDKLVKLSSFNPIKLAKSIQQFVGNVRNVKYCRNGTLLITAANESQYVRMRLLKTFCDHDVILIHPNSIVVSEIVASLSFVSIDGGRRLTTNVDGVLLYFAELGPLVLYPQSR